jgi:Protein of unknown function (DUF2927)
MNIGTLKNNIFSHSGTRVALLISVLLGAAIAPVQAEDSAITSRRAAERVEFSNDEIRDGFFKIAFHAEMQVGAPADRIRKFDEPVRIYVDSKAQPDRSAQLDDVVADIRARVNHLDIAITHDREAANFVVILVRDREVDTTIRARYGKERAREIKQSLKPQCLSGIGKDGQFRIRRAEAILPVDAGDFTFLDCAYEELLQGLGVINDDASVPWTMFNDDVQMGFFDVYDQYLLNILYDPRVRPGMTPSEVNALMGELLPTARTFVGGATSHDRAKLHDGLRASATSSAGTN